MPGGIFFYGGIFLYRKEARRGRRGGTVKGACGRRGGTGKGACGRKGGTGKGARGRRGGAGKGLARPEERHSQRVGAAKEGVGAHGIRGARQSDADRAGKIKADRAGGGIKAGRAPGRW